MSEKAGTRGSGRERGRRAKKAGRERPAPPPTPEFLELYGQEIAEVNDLLGGLRYRVREALDAAQKSGATGKVQGLLGLDHLLTNVNTFLHKTRHLPENLPPTVTANIVTARRSLIGLLRSANRAARTNPRWVESAFKDDTLLIDSLDDALPGLSGIITLGRTGTVLTTTPGGLSGDASLDLLRHRNAAVARAAVAAGQAIKDDAGLSAATALRSLAAYGTNRPIGLALGSLADEVDNLSAESRRRLWESLSRALSEATEAGRRPEPASVGGTVLRALLKSADDFGEPIQKWSQRVRGDIHVIGAVGLDEFMKAVGPVLSGTTIDYNDPFVRRAFERGLAARDIAVRELNPVGLDEKTLAAAFAAAAEEKGIPTDVPTTASRINPARVVQEGAAEAFGTPGPKRSRRALKVAIGLGLAGAAASWWWQSRRRAPEPVAAPTPEELAAMTRRESQRILFSPENASTLNVLFGARDAAMGRGLEISRMQLETEKLIGEIARQHRAMARLSPTASPLVVQDLSTMMEQQWGSLMQDQQNAEQNLRRLALQQP